MSDKGVEYLRRFARALRVDVGKAADVLDEMLVEIDREEAEAKERYASFERNVAEHEANNPTLTPSPETVEQSGSRE